MADWERRDREGGLCPKEYRQDQRTPSQRRNIRFLQGLNEKTTLLQCDTSPGKLRLD